MATTCVPPKVAACNSCANTNTANCSGNNAISNQRTEAKNKLTNRMALKENLIKSGFINRNNTISAITPKAQSPPINVEA